MLEYHDFQLSHKNHDLHRELAKLAQWQSERLKHSHNELYSSPNYQQGQPRVIQGRMNALPQGTAHGLAQGTTRQTSQQGIPTFRQNKPGNNLNVQGLPAIP